jgi:hypothetical protein
VTTLINWRKLGPRVDADVTDLPDGQSMNMNQGAGVGSDSNQLGHGMVRISRDGAIRLAHGSGHVTDNMKTCSRDDAFHSVHRIFLVNLMTGMMAGCS